MIAQGNGTNGHGAVKTPAPKCLRCGGDVFDNRGDKVNAKSPDFRCKNASCTDDDGRRSAFWARDFAAKPNGNGNSNGQHAPATDRVAELLALHHRLLSHVVKNELPLIAGLAGDVAGAASALTAQLFIALSKDGGRQ